MVRQERHKVHVMALLAMGLIRNRWLNDPELQVRLQLFLRKVRCTSADYEPLTALCALVRAGPPRLAGTGGPPERLCASPTPETARACSTAPCPT
jgi:hypothetical protein